MADTFINLRPGFSTCPPDLIAKAFNERKPPNWTARVYSRARNSGTYNAVHFTYKAGMVSFIMDCDRPIGNGFQVKFHNFNGAFGDFQSAIQRGLCVILLKLKAAKLNLYIPDDLAPAQLSVALRKDGTVTYIAIVGIDGFAELFAQKDDPADELC